MQYNLEAKKGEVMADRRTLTGKVKWFCNKRGWGFLISSRVNGDIMVHYSNISGTGFKKLQEGQKVTFRLAVGNRGRYKALDVKPVKDGTLTKRFENLFR